MNRARMSGVVIDAAQSRHGDADGVPCGGLDLFGGVTALQAEQRGGMGAALAAALICLQRGDTTEQVQAAARHAIGIAMAGLRSVDDNPKGQQPVPVRTS